MVHNLQSTIEVHNLKNSTESAGHKFYDCKILLPSLIINETTDNFINKSIREVKFYNIKIHYIILLNWLIPENIQTGRGSWGYTFLTKLPRIFKFITLPLEIPEKASFLHPWKFCKIVWHSAKTYENSIWVFLEHPWKFHFYFGWPLEFPHAFSSISREVPCPQPRCLDFFWNSLFEVVFILNFTFAVFYYHGATAMLWFHDSVLIFSYLSCLQKVFT